MPIYEYVCQGCGHRFDVLQKINEAPVASCPSCYAGAVTKWVSAAGFQLRGTGWYATDFKDKPKAAAPPAEKATPAADTVVKKDTSA